MAKTPEGEVKKGIKKVLTSHGIFYYMPVNNGMGVGGASDFLCCRPIVVTQEMVGRTLGVWLAVEAKAPGKTATDRQDQFIEQITSRGGQGHVIDDAQVLKELLEREHGQQGDLR